MRRRHDANIDCQLSFAADAFERPVLENPQQAHLGGRGQFAALIKKERAAVRALEPALADIHGTGETSLFVTKEFRIHKLRWNGAAIDSQKRPGNAA